MLAAACAVTMLVVGAGASGAASPDPEPIDAIRQAKLGLAAFVTDHVDRPLAVAEPCPTLPADVSAGLLGAAGLTASQRDYGAAIVFDHTVGGGLVAVRCGNDLARSPDPAGAVSVSLDVAMLDGQASFAQLAVVIGGRDAVVSDVAADPALAGVAPSAAVQVARCTNGGRDCTAAVAVDGLAVIARLRGLPVESGEAVARRMSLDAVPVAVANLATIAESR